MKIIEGDGWLCSVTDRKLSISHHKRNHTPKLFMPVNVTGGVTENLTECTVIARGWINIPKKRQVEVIELIRQHRHSSLDKLVALLRVELGHYEVKGFGWMAMVRGSTLSLEYKNRVEVFHFHRDDSQLRNYIHQLLSDHKRCFHKTILQKLKTSFSKAFDLT
jgi:hypothetical protein